jgi:hypothetical protein
MIMKKLFYFVIFAFNSGYLCAQNFTGKVLDENMQPVVFANIIVLVLPDSAFAGGTTSAETGDFTVTVNKPVTDYLLTVSCLGYESFSLALNENSRRNLEDIILKTVAIQMQSVSVVARLPQIRFEKGKHIVNIENSMAAMGNTMESLFNQLPGVWASSNEISINGKSGVAVYINDRQVNLQGEALMKYLQNLRSEDVSKLEIMQSASAEYSAEGSGGVIRIITKRIIDEGYRGAISATTLYQNYPGVMPYFGFQYGKDKFGAQFSFSGEKSKWLSYLEDNSQDLTNGTNYNETGTDTISDFNYSSSLTLNYDFDRYNKLIVNANYLYWGKDEHINQLTEISGNLQDNITSTHNDHKAEQDMYNYSFTVNYSLLLDTVGRNKISLLADYVNQYKYNTKDYLHYLNKSNDGTSVSDEYLLNDQNKPYQIYSAEVRYRYDFGKASSGLTGLKYGYSSVGNDFYNYENVSGAWTLHPEIGYNYQYTEQIVSGFYQYELTKEKWSIVAGLRGEYTDGKVKDMADNPARFDLFPSIYYDYKPNEHHNLGFSYTRRIRRISYFTLLPQRFYSSRYTMIMGNPELKPDILNNLGLNYSINDKYSLSLSYSWSTNALSRYNKTELIDGRSILVSTYTDGIKSQNFNANIYIPFNLTAWWSCTAQASLNLDTYKTPENKFGNFNYDLYTQHDFNLPFSIKGQVLYRYYSKSKSAYSISYPYNLLNIYLQKAFLKNKKLNVKLEANRLIFNKSGEETTTTQAFMQYYMYGKNPLFRLTVTYSFGKGKAKQMQRAQNSNEQEKNRTY